MPSAAAKRTDLAEIERRRLLRLEAQERSRANEADIEAHRAELMVQADARGEEYLHPTPKRGERRKPIRRICGLDWLLGKKRITLDQHAAGERYGTAFRRSQLAPPLKSVLNREVTSSDPQTLASLLDHARGTERARQRLVMYRHQLRGLKDLIRACDTICGQEMTPRQASPDGHEAERLEAWLGVALSLMAQHLASSRTSDPGIPQDVA